MKNQKLEYYADCVAYFLDRYLKITNVKYSFEAKDGKALKAILIKIDNIKAGSNRYEVFKQIIYNLPKWDVENAFSLTSINSRFNVIIASITKKQSISNGYKEQIITDIFK